MNRTTAFLIAATFAGAAGATPPTGDAHRDDVLAWRAERVERLRKPDGWLSLVGLHWLSPGAQRVGSAADNDVVLAVGPAHLGTITLDTTRVTLALADGAKATIGDGSARSGELMADSAGSPTLVAFERGGFNVIERSGRFGLRVRDPEAKTRAGFVGIDYFDVDPAWRFEARFEAHPPGRTIDIASVINTLEPMKNPGVVVFEKDGREYRLEALDDTGDGQLFLIFADRTSGKTTYGPGRFLYAPPPVDGRTVVDFNRSYNPPCAFNAYSTCPLPPPENRLDLVIEAGEKKYRGATH
jgi:uncharacterized protein (DUF1684 family)